MPNIPEPWSERREAAKQVRRFIVIGCLSVATDMAVYFLLLRLGMSKHIAKGISYVAGMVLGFIGNKLWTFESARRSVAEPIVYVILYTITLGVNVGINAAAFQLLHGFLAERTAKILAFFVATGVTTVLNFLGMRLITFRGGVNDRRQRHVAPTTQEKSE